MRTHNLTIVSQGNGINPGQVAFVEAEVPDLGPGQVMVGGAAVAFCAGDKQKSLGSAPVDELPHWFGHEDSGTILQIGPGVTRLRPGDRVAVWPPAGLGFGTRMVALEKHCVVGNDVPLELLCLAEPLGCCYNAVEFPLQGAGYGVTRREDVLILGGRFMAQALIPFILQHQPRTVILAARNPQQRKLAKALGATHTVDLGTEDLRAAVRKHTEGRGASVVFECIGEQVGYNYAEQVAADWELRLKFYGQDPRLAGMRIITVGYHQSDNGVRVTNARLRNVGAVPEIPAHFRHEGDILRGMADVVAQMASGRLDPEPLCGRPFGAEDVQEAMIAAASGDDGRKVRIIVDNT